MTLFRKIMLLIAALVPACLVLPANALPNVLPNVLPNAPMGASDALHLLGRTTFDISDARVAEFAGLTRAQAISRLLQPVAAQPSVAPPDEIMRYQRRRDPNDMTAEEFKRWQVEQREAGVAMRAWWVDEMLAASTPQQQLRERMVLFWHNHFVSSNKKVRSSKLMIDQNQLFRANALGNFGTLLHAVGHDPAMVIYLDSTSNRKGSPNENFAREVMELFTLGEGHYGERDVKEAARAFTGWSLDRDSGEFKWRPFQHDDGDKVVLGKSGRFDGDDVLDILLAQDATARFVAQKLWREFISPTPDQKELDAIAGRFRQSNYDIRTALRAVLESDAFWAKENREALVKSPVDLVIGTLRTYDVHVPDTRKVAMALREMGQDLFVPPNVRGWPGGDQWINSSTLLVRKSVLERLLATQAFRRLPESQQTQVNSVLLAANYQVK